MDTAPFLQIHCQNTQNVSGVGYVVHPSVVHLVDSYEIPSPCLAKFRLQPRLRKKISIINWYSPTGVANESELDAFHNELGKVMQNEKSSYKLVVGDLNTRMGTMDEKHYRIGKFGLGDRNEGGECLAALLSTACLFHENAFFVKKENRRWT
ncbi:hypothetical protein DICVIV_07699 [Dictyocaulus viviparus]|uniref:Endonuclease/exonuclease/phosphatase domain-containing protein n=1 Tax=Dictyocaulus viviparus TaxID=29172 RepID=A0A0D8XNX8_DICVI|nr:hypothetical protein DICVIV_07699 [Dictyocaulus viviparus]